MEITVTYNKEEYDLLVYAAREAQIRFKRLRKRILRDDFDVSHWDIDEVNEQINHWKTQETKLTNKFQELTGESWY